MSKTVVLGLDGSPDSALAVPYATEQAGPDGRIVAVHVREILMGRAGGQTAAANEDEIEQAVRRQVDEISKTGISTELKVITAPVGGPAHVLGEVAREVHGDLIVVGTRGHRQITGLIIGSVTHRLLHIAPCAVLIVPPAAARHAAESAQSAVIAGSL